MTNDIRFVTLEDITGEVYSKNYIVYNPALNEKRRMKLFKQFMSARFSHQFTVDELKYLATFDEYHLIDFIDAVRNIIHLVMPL